MNDPPDKISEQLYTIVKVPLKKVLKNHSLFQPIIEKTVLEINDLVIVGYQFINAFLLYKISKNETFPTINKEFVLHSLRTLTSKPKKESKKQKAKKRTHKEIKLELINFYNSEFKKCLLIDSVDGEGIYLSLNSVNKTHIIQQTANEMITCIKTNLTTHYYEYLCKYINIVHKIPKANEIKKTKDKKVRKELYKVLNQEIRDLKMDVARGQIIDSKEEYHQWINTNLPLLIHLNKFPKDKNVAYDIKSRNRTELYYRNAFYINKQLELLGAKPYQIIPQRQNIVPKHIVLNTPAIADLLGDNSIFTDDTNRHINKSELVLHAKRHNQHIWGKVLKTEMKSVFQHRDHVFYNQISTDGFSCSIYFIDKKFKNKKFGEHIKEIEIDEDNYEALETFDKEKCDEILRLKDEDKYKFLSEDPGVNRPISLIDEEGKYFKCTGQRIRFENYTKGSSQILYKEKEKNNIFTIETEFANQAKNENFSSRTMNYSNFLTYVNKKLILNEKLKAFYQNILWRKLSFRRFVRTKQFYVKLLNEIENCYLTKEEIQKGKKIVIFYGDWSRSTCMKGTMPTPNKTIKRILSKRFQIYNVNEYYTSKLYNQTHSLLENVSVKKNKHKKHLHEILSPVVSDLPNNIWKPVIRKCKRFINRDKNACKNILYVALHYLKNQKRPEEFSRKEQNKDKHVLVKKPRQTKKRVNKSSS